LEQQFSTKFFNTLSHPTDSDANASGAKLRGLLCDPLAVIAHFDYDLAANYQQGDPCIVRSRMSKHIRQRLLNNSEDCDL
jgi:hypothetical protein